MKIIRWLLARVILLVDFFYRPRGVKRKSIEQQEIERQLKTISLYQYAACPFCVKVRWMMKRQALPMETRDAKRDALAAKELVEGGGLLKVPCLRVDDSNGSSQWIYESSNITEYLEQRFC